VLYRPVGPTGGKGEPLDVSDDAFDPVRDEVEAGMKVCRRGWGVACD